MNECIFKKRHHMMCLDAKSVVYTVRNECMDMQCVCMYGMELVMVQQTVRNSGQCEKVLRT